MVMAVNNGSLARYVDQHYQAEQDPDTGYTHYVRWYNDDTYIMVWFKQNCTVAQTSEMFLNHKNPILLPSLNHLKYIELTLTQNL